VEVAEKTAMALSKTANSLEKAGAQAARALQVAADKLQAEREAAETAVAAAAAAAAAAHEITEPSRYCARREDVCFEWEYTGPENELTALVQQGVRGDIVYKEGSCAGFAIIVQFVPSTLSQWHSIRT
jgi:hypothetical protein